MADVSQDQGGTQPRRPVLRPFSGAARGAGQGPLKPLGARRLAVSTFPIEPENQAPGLAETRAPDVAELPIAATEAGAVAIAPPSVAAEELVSETSEEFRAETAIAIPSSDPAAMPLDVAPESALDVGSLVSRDAAELETSLEEIAFGSAAVAPATGGVEIDADIIEVDSHAARPEQLETAESSMAVSLDASAASFVAEGASVELLAADATEEVAAPADSVGLMDEAVEATVSQAPAGGAIAYDAADYSDAESVMVDAFGTVDDEVGAIDNVAERESLFPVDVSGDASDHEAAPTVAEATSSPADWSGELESVRLEAEQDVANPSDLLSVSDIVAVADVEQVGGRASIAEGSIDAVEVTHADTGVAAVLDAADDESHAPIEAAVPLLDVELNGFHLKPEEVLVVPAPIPGMEQLIAEPDGRADMAAEVPGEMAGGIAAEWPTSDDRGGSSEPTAAADAVREDADVSWRVASAPPETLAQADADLQEFVFRSRSQAHVLETLEAVARRVRGGEIVPTTDAGASPEAVLASVLASLLSARP